MFKYTRAAISMIFDGFKKTLYWATVLSNAVYIAYLIFALCTGTGFWFVNAALLAINVAYLVFFFVMEGKKKQAEESKNKQDDKQAERTSSRGNRLFSLFKVLIQFVNLGIIIYGIAFLGNDLPPLNIILVTLMIIFLLLQILFIVLGQVVDGLKVLIEDAWEADMDGMKTPGRVAGNLFRRLLGKEETAAPEPTKAKKKLDKFITKKKEEKERKAAAKKAKKAEAKAAKKAEKTEKQPKTAKHQASDTAQAEAAATKTK